MTTISRQAVRLSTKNAASTWKAPAGIQSQSLTVVPPSPAAPVRVWKTTIIAIAQVMATSATGTTQARRPRRRPTAAVKTKPAIGRAAMSGISDSMLTGASRRTRRRAASCGCGRSR